MQNVSKLVLHAAAHPSPQKRCTVSMPVIAFYCPYVLLFFYDSYFYVVCPTVLLTGKWTPWFNILSVKNITCFWSSIIYSTSKTLIFLYFVCMKCFLSCFTLWSVEDIIFLDMEPPVLWYVSSSAIVTGGVRFVLQIPNERLGEPHGC